MVITKDEVFRIVAGNVRATIHDHGPITHEFVASAAKRIAGKLHSELVRRGLAKPARSSRARPLDQDDAAREG